MHEKKPNGKEDRRKFVRYAEGAKMYGMVYMSDDGEVIIDHLSPKEMLDSFRLLCKGKKEPDKELCAKFNDETEDGRKMGKYSDSAKLVDRI